MAVLFYMLEILKQLVTLSFMCIITGRLSLQSQRYIRKSYRSKFTYSNIASIATCHWINYIWWMVSMVHQSWSLILNIEGSAHLLSSSILCFNLEIAIQMVGCSRDTALDAQWKSLVYSKLSFIFNCHLEGWSELRKSQERMLREMSASLCIWVYKEKQSFEFVSWGTAFPSHMVLWIQQCSQWVPCKTLWKCVFIRPQLSCRP